MLSLHKYLFFSSLAAGAVTYHAFATRHQYFPAVYYMSTSKVSVAIMGNMAFALALLLYKLITKVFLGTLRDAEVELINDRLSQAVMETCLAMTIFQREFNAEFITMFTVLTFVKVFHWLLQDRVDFLETSPNVSRLQHFRIVAFQGVLLALDCAFLEYTIGTMRRQGPSVLLLFTFEYVILASTVLSIAVKYVMFVIDTMLEGRWEGKGVYVFYLDLVTTMLHLVVYLIFFLIVFNNYGLPLHLVRDLYWTFRTFRNRVSDFLRYRRVTVNMDDRLPEATADDLLRSDATCIVCREEMTLGGHNKKLRCGHVFHLRCLRSWLERQQNCPICRSAVVEPPPTPSQPPAAAQQQQQPQQQPAAAQQPPADAPAAVGAARQPAPGAELRQRRPAAPAAQQGPPGPSAGGPSQGPAAGAAGPSGSGAGGSGTATVHQGMAASPYLTTGIVYNMPTLPMTSMALYIPAGGYPMQYAGQQNPGSGAAGSQGHFTGVVPVMPLLFPQPMHTPQGPLTPEQQQQQAAATAAAAAAAAAASAAGVLGPFGLPLMPAMGPAMMPAAPSQPPSTPSTAPSTEAGPSSSANALPRAEQQLLAANASAAAAAAAMTHVPGGVGSHSTQEELDKMLERHMNLLRKQMEQIRMPQQTTATAPSSSAPSARTSATQSAPATSAGQASNGAPNGQQQSANVQQEIAQEPSQAGVSAASGSAGVSNGNTEADKQDGSNVQTGESGREVAGEDASNMSEEERLRLKRLAHFDA